MPVVTGMYAGVQQHVGRDTAISTCSSGSSIVLNKHTPRPRPDSATSEARQSRPPTPRASHDVAKMLQGVFRRLRSLFLFALLGAMVTLSLCSVLPGVGEESFFLSFGRVMGKGELPPSLSLSLFLSVSVSVYVRMCVWCACMHV